ncbi:hypothetical protein U9M48_015205 [Paspalum notatum var. saurae]|uniref:Uncharacterized protein n=1 Tax=Paspalum notatum var. saurae TaxID=547442 RepID=A0AAQ3T4F0_PASNO
MLLYTPPSLLIPSATVPVVVEEMVALRLCSCSSMLISSERRLEGKLADLRMEAMAATRAAAFSCFLLKWWSRENEEKLNSNGVYQAMVSRVRTFRRETLLWISILNKVSTLPSKWEMPSSISCNCSSHTTLLFWNVLEMRDHLLELGIAICFNKSCDEDSSIKTAVSLASDIILIKLHCGLRVDLLELFPCLLRHTHIGLDLGLNSCIISFLESQLHFQDAFLELGEALLHVAAKVKQDKRALKLLLHCFPLLWNLAASFLKPLHMVSMVAEGEEMVVFKLRSCSSTSILLEHGLEGTLADLRWKAMASVEPEAKSIQKRDPALDQSPEDSLNRALKTSNLHLQRLQPLLLARGSSLP